MLKLLSFDPVAKTTVSIPVRRQMFVEHSGTVRRLVEDVGDAVDEIPLPSVAPDVLQLVVDYCSSKNDPGFDINAYINSLGSTKIFDVMIAANYLDIQSLLNLLVAAVGKIISKCKTPEDIRKTFNISNDLTPAEEAEIVRQNAWALE